VLSNDLGAVAAFLFDVGSGRYPAPPRPEDATADARRTWRDALEEAVQASVAAAAPDDVIEELSHTQVQGWLRDLGKALGFAVWIASNDQQRELGTGRLGDGCLEVLPDALQSGPGGDAIRLIDVLWLDTASQQVRAAFEVEHTTSIYSGIVRLLDLALGAGAGTAHGLYLVAPDAREPDVRAQLARPAFSRIGKLAVRFISYGALAEHRENMARFGSGSKAIEAIAKAL
jgi:type II restriction enzyme